MHGSEADILILGGGPTGLGAACRLQEAGGDWTLLEAEDHFGGLASSFVDACGFTWDLGGHIHFSHYDTFDRYLALAIPEEGWIPHQRESWIRIGQRFVPYPFQNNIHRLSPEDAQACLRGLREAQGAVEAEAPAHFDAWIRRTFGSGIADLFLLPYNRKVWAYPLEQLGWNWIGERVAVPDCERLAASVANGRDDTSWGPNSVFRFPKHGGTGAIWTAVGRRLPAARVHLNSRVTAVDWKARRVVCADGREFGYRRLISTLPLNHLIRIAPGRVESRHAAALRHSAVHVVGIGVAGAPPEALRSKCWIYFPEPRIPYYRATVFSNYSPFNVPRPGEQWSIMLEISESSHRRVCSADVLDAALDGLAGDGLLPDRAAVVSTTTRYLAQAYPTPFLGRDERVDPILRAFEAEAIYSRGRFGAWKYEVGNEDHSFAQGWECANRMLGDGGPEAEPTLFTPSLVNSRRNP